MLLHFVYKSIISISISIYIYQNILENIDFIFRIIRYICVPQSAGRSGLGRCFHFGR